MKIFCALHKFFLRFKAWKYLKANLKLSYYGDNWYVILPLITAFALHVVIHTLLKKCFHLFSLFISHKNNVCDFHKKQEIIPLPHFCMRYADKNMQKQIFACTYFCLCISCKNEVIDFAKQTCYAQKKNFISNYHAVWLKNLLH